MPEPLKRRGIKRQIQAEAASIQGKIPAKRKMPPGIHRGMAPAPHHTGNDDGRPAATIAGKVIMPGHLAQPDRTLKHNLRPPGGNIDVQHAERLKPVHRVKFAVVHERLPVLAVLRPGPAGHLHIARHVGVHIVEDVIRVLPRRHRAQHIRPVPHHHQARVLARRLAAPGRRIRPVASRQVEPPHPYFAVVMGGEIRAAVHIHQHMPPKRAQHLATAHGETMEHIGRLANLHQLRVNLRAANDTHVTLGPDRTTLAAGIRRSLRETKIRYNSLPSARSPAVGIPPCARATRPICSIAWEANKTPAGEVSSPAARKASNVQVLQV